MADKFYSLFILKHVAFLFPLVLKGAANRIAEDLSISLAIGELLTDMSNLMRVVKALHFTSGIGKILAHSEISIS